MKNYSSLIFVLFILISTLLRSAGNKGKKSGTQAGKQSPGQPAVPGQTRRAPARASRPAKASQAADADHTSWRAAKEAECEYGDVNHRYSHSADRRVAQLNGYLKAGLIDRKEYSQMLERYQRMDREAGMD